MRIGTGLHPSEFRPGVPQMRPYLAFQGETVKVYKATFGADTEDQTVVPVAAQSLQHAARKASAQEAKHGELVKVELTTDILI